jgi:adenylosuccinate lyase
MQTLPKVPRLSTEEKKTICAIAATFGEKDGALVKQIETEGYKDIPATNHDVKAVEYFLRIRLTAAGLEKYIPWVHFAATSEDVNNISYACMLRDAAQVIIDDLTAIEDMLRVWGKEYASLPMLARTHGQSASPTTFGKEMVVFAERLKRQREQILSTHIQAKWNGATGNYNAHVAAFPEADWPAFSQRFVESFNKKDVGVSIKWNPVSTQIDPHDSYIELLHAMHRANTILTGFAQDMWRYISDGWIILKKKEGEVGSSTMPHKVNPIDFENAEGNMQIANGLIEAFARRLPISRLQRDLSDSTTLRALGTAFGHMHIGLGALLRGMGKCTPHTTKIRGDLAAHLEVITEALQTILRREHVPNAYELLKQLSRGEQLTSDAVGVFIEGLPVAASVKKELRAITPETYTGLAHDIARQYSTRKKRST